MNIQDINDYNQLQAYSNRACAYSNGILLPIKPEFMTSSAQQVSIPSSLMSPSSTPNLATDHLSQHDQTILPNLNTFQNFNDLSNFPTLTSIYSFYQQQQSQIDNDLHNYKSNESSHNQTSYNSLFLPSNYQNNQINNQINSDNLYYTIEQQQNNQFFANQQNFRQNLENYTNCYHSSQNEPIFCQNQNNYFDNYQRNGPTFGSYTNCEPSAFSSNQTNAPINSLDQINRLKKSRPISSSKTIGNQIQASQNQTHLHEIKSLPFNIHSDFNIPSNQCRKSSTQIKQSKKFKDLFEPLIDLTQPNVTTIMQRPVDMGETKRYKRRNCDDLEKRRTYCCKYEGFNNYFIIFLIN